MVASVLKILRKQTEISTKIIKLLSLLRLCSRPDQNVLICYEKCGEKKFIKIGSKIFRNKSLTIFFVLMRLRIPKPPGSWRTSPPTPPTEIPPPVLGLFWAETPSHLVIGYHWLAFLNKVRKKPQFSKNFKHKIKHFSKNIYRKNLKIVF